MTASHYLNVNDLALTYPGDIHALASLNFQQAEGELVTIVGPSGCGKTTLGKAVLQLILPSAGSVRLGGTGRNVESRGEIVLGACDRRECARDQERD